MPKTCVICEHFKEGIQRSWGKHCCGSCKMQYYRDLNNIFYTSLSDLTTVGKNNSATLKFETRISDLTKCQCAIFDFNCQKCKFRKSILTFNGQVPGLKFSKQFPNEYRVFVFMFPKIAIEMLKSGEKVEPNDSKSELLELKQTELKTIELKPIDSKPIEPTQKRPKQISPVQTFLPTKSVVPSLNHVSPTTKNPLYCQGRNSVRSFINSIYKSKKSLQFLRS